MVHMRHERLFQALGRFIRFDFASQIAWFGIHKPEEKKHTLFARDTKSFVQGKIEDDIAVHGIAGQHATLARLFGRLDSQNTHTHILPLSAIQAPDFRAHFMRRRFILFTLALRGKCVGIRCPSI